MGGILQILQIFHPPHFIEQPHVIELPHFIVVWSESSIRKAADCYELAIVGNKQGIFNEMLLTLLLIIKLYSVKESHLRHFWIKIYGKRSLNLYFVSS